MRASGTSDLTNIDTVDAALCALIACYFLSGNVKTYGDVVEGFIVVPAIIEVQVRRIKDIGGLKLLHLDIKL